MFNVMLGKVLSSLGLLPVFEAVPALPSHIERRCFELASR